MPDPVQHRWNHNNYAVPPARLPLIEACFDALFPWAKIVSKPHLLGYRLGDDLHAAALYFRPVAAAASLHAAVTRLRAQDPELDLALVGLESVEVDYNDHSGFMVPTVAEWEERLAIAERLQRDRPEFEIRVADVYRPGDGRALTDYLYQAFIRIGLLGPYRNTFEMQARL
ncbi:MAG: hypothetical protein HYR72_24515 [Deltaproteobacteria bacterium]|nr:hypothetical protein [Deltaproteobacteria bacterium]MBI3389267.1 hypothetical protein [Deltaproteobacteria bacterium]